MRPVLHVITDETTQSSYTHATLARLVSANGADFVQYREKRNLDTRTLCRNAATIMEICAQSEHSQLVVNDRVDVAYAIGAQAIHLGRQDLKISVARRILGPDALIGGTSNSLDEATQLSNEPVDYLGVGPIFGTVSKENPAPQLGLARLARICSDSPHPVIAIGNIRIENVPDVIEAGATGIAVLSAIASSDDPGRATFEFVKALEEC